MWLFGVKVYTTKSSLDLQNQPSIPLSSVEERLSHMGLALSDKAEAFKQLVQNFQKSPDPNIGDMISNLLISNLVKNKSPSPEKDLQQLMKLMPKEIRDSQNNVSADVMAVNSNLNRLVTSKEKSPAPVVKERYDKQHFLFLPKNILNACLHRHVSKLVIIFILSKIIEYVLLTRKCTQCL